MKRLLMLMLVVVFVGVCLAEESDAGVFKKGPTYIFGWRRPDRDVNPAPDVKPPALPPSLSPPTQKERQLTALIAEVQKTIADQTVANAKAIEDAKQAREVAIKQDEIDALNAEKQKALDDEKTSAVLAATEAKDSESDVGWFDNSGNQVFAAGTSILSLLGLGGALKFGGLSMPTPG